MYPPSAGARGGSGLEPAGICAPARSAAAGMPLLGAGTVSPAGGPAMGAYDCGGAPMFGPTIS